MTAPGPGRVPELGHGRPLAVVRGSRTVSTVRESDLDDVVELARLLLEAPYAAVRFVQGTPRRAEADVPDGHPAPVVTASELALASETGVVDLPVGSGGPLSDPVLDRHGPPVRRMAAVCLTAPDGRRIGGLEVGWTVDRAPLDTRERAALEQLATHASGAIALRAEATEYRRFVDLNPDAVTVLDLEGAIELANPAMAALVGEEHAGALIGRPFLDLVQPADRSRVAVELAQVLLSRHRTARLDLALQRVDGDVLPCALHAANLLGGRRSLQLVLHDLSDRIRAEDERARLSEQLGHAQRLDLAGRLASGLAHDLNNHLAVMHVSLDLVEGDVADLTGSHEALTALREDLEQLARSVDHASQLTGKLLAFARQEPEAPGPVDVAASLTAVERLLRPTLRTDVTLRVALEPPLPTVTADRIQLEQAVVNLVVNAVDAVGEAGTIVVRASSTDAGWVRIAVVDDGPGMHDETAARAFEPLFSTRKGQGGTGLGLPTVQAFVEHLGGQVAMRSHPGAGTEVALLLPATEHGEAAAAARGGGAGADVLLVDPSDAARRAITAMLRSAGHRVTAVTSGEEALRTVDVQTVDLLVTDVALPGRSGWRLLEQLRERVPELPTIVFTASDVPADARRVRTLVKPFSHERLLRAVGELLTPVR